MDQIVQLVEAQKEIWDELVQILKNIENSCLNEKAIQQCLRRVEDLETELRSNNEKINDLADGSDICNVENIFQIGIKLLDRVKAGIQEYVDVLEETEEVEDDTVTFVSSKDSEEESSNRNEDLLKDAETSQVEFSNIREELLDETNLLIGDQKFLQDVTVNLYILFRKQIEKLELSLTDITSDNDLILRQKRSFWKRKMASIVKIYHMIEIHNNSTFSKAFLEEDFELINKKYEEAVYKLTKKMHDLRNVAKPAAIQRKRQPISSPNFQRDYIKDLQASPNNIHITNVSDVTSIFVQIILAAVTALFKLVLQINNE